MNISTLEDICKERGFTVEDIPAKLREESMLTPLSEVSIHSIIDDMVRHRFLERIIHSIEQVGAVVAEGRYIEGSNGVYTAQIYCVDHQAQTGQYDFAFSLRLEAEEK